MTTNFPNPVDGDVQAHQMPSAWIIETPDNGVRYVELKKDLADRVAQGCAKEGIRVVITPLYTTTPAQLLRPVKLPEAKDIHDGKSEKARQRCEGWNACLAEVQRLNATAHPVSDGCKVPEGWMLVPIEPTEEMVAAWREDMDRSYAGYYADGIGEDEIVFAYQAMLAAAPEVAE